MREPETWRPVVGYEGLYEVSSEGRVRSMDRVVEMRNRWGTTTHRLQRGRILKPFQAIESENYRRLYVSLYDAEGCASCSTVHRLVCETFHGHKPAGMEVAHWDGDALNNREGNLRWATCFDNHQDKRRHGTIPQGAARKFAKLTEDRVRQILAIGRSVPQALIAAEFGISQGVVSAIQLGKRWSHVR